jgi:4-amino-4-deoxy-L-arabinose transferase-like glycosyltransferase
MIADGVSTEKSSGRMSSRTERLDGSPLYGYAVIALTVVALAVRLPGLNTGLWVDEILSIVEAFRTPFPQSLAEFPYDHKHPLYSVLAHACIVLFGEHAWSVRLPAVLFGVASVPALYLLGARIASQREGLAASALLALSYHHVWFSQNARGYTMLAFWTIVGTLALVSALESRALKPWAVYGVIAGLGVYTHLTYVFVAAGHGIAVLLAVFQRRGGGDQVRIAGAISAYVIGASIALLLYAPMLGKLIDFFLTQKSQLQGVSTPGWALSEGLRVLALGFGILGAVGAVVLLACAAIGVAGLASYMRRQSVVAMLLVLPAIVMLTGALTLRGTMYPRFFFALIGPALLVWMRGLFVVADWIAGRAGLAHREGFRPSSMIATLVVVVSALSVPLNWRAPKQDFAGAMHYVDSSVAPGEIIATADVTSLIYRPFYRRDWPAVASAEDLATLRGQGPVWLVYTFPRYLAVLDSGIARTVARECESARRFRGTVGDGDVVVCRLERT